MTWESCDARLRCTGAAMGIVAAVSGAASVGCRRFKVQPGARAGANSGTSFDSPIARSTRSIESGSWIAASSRLAPPERGHVNTSTPNAHSTQRCPRAAAKATPTPLAGTMRHTLPLHTSPTGHRGDFLGVRFLSIRAAIVGLFPFVSCHNPRHDPSPHARSRSQHTVVGHQLLSRSRHQGSTTAQSTPVAPKPTCVVPSRHVCFSEYATRPSGSSDRRLSAIAGRPAYLNKCSSRLRSPAATRTAPCNEKPSKSAHSGPFTNGSLRVPPPTRTSRWPARSPDSATPCTAAAASSSSSCSPTSPPHDTSASLASASSGHFPICRSLRRTRSRTRWDVAHSDCTMRYKTVPSGSRRCHFPTCATHTEGSASLRPRQIAQGIHSRAKRGSGSAPGDEVLAAFQHR
ncbi:MAG: hypothetical protein ACI9SE_003439 [Neolewinella sp.]|jgi:hypothetical protein